MFGYRLLVPAPTDELREPGCVPKGVTAVEGR